MTNTNTLILECIFKVTLKSILKSRDIALPARICIVKDMVFPVVMYGYESWTIKKAEHWRIDAFKLWCLRVPWTAWRSNQSILKGINPVYSLEGLMLKLKFQRISHLMGRTDSLEETLMLGKIEGRREVHFPEKKDSILSIWQFFPTQFMDPTFTFFGCKQQIITVVNVSRKLEKVWDHLYNFRKNWTFRCREDTNQRSVGNPKHKTYRLSLKGITMRWFCTDNLPSSCNLAQV